MIAKRLLSLRDAILININIMLGSGIFINTAILAKNMGLLSGCMYLFNGILILPLILSMTSLVRMHPRGGFYTFGAQEINSFTGFLSAWSYFIGKLASATLMIHTAFLLIQTIIPSLQCINVLYLDILTLFFFTGLNLLQMKVSVGVQSTTFIIKLIPIIFVILSGLFLINPTQWVLPVSFFSVINSMPFVLFTALGFEATLSLSNSIENPGVNGPRAILIAFFTVLGLSFLFQTLMYLALGNALATFPNYLFAFPALTSLIWGQSSCVSYLSSFFHLAIATSALGGAYGILFSTHWNLYAIAQHNAIWGAHFFTRLNKHAMPFVGVILQAIICILYLIGTQGNQIPLQLTASIGCTIAYTISIIALLNNQRQPHAWIARLALINCFIFIASTLYSLYVHTATSATFFAIMLIIGILMHIIKKP